MLLKWNGICCVKTRHKVTWPRGKSQVKSTLIIGHFRVVRQFMPPINTRVIGQLASFWRIAIASRVICQSLLHTKICSARSTVLFESFALSWLDIKCMKRTAPKSWAKYTTCTWRAALKSWSKYSTDKVGRINTPVGRKRYRWHENAHYRLLIVLRSKFL